jgi:DGQHR domain-containing protein
MTPESLNGATDRRSLAQIRPAAAPQQFQRRGYQRPPEQPRVARIGRYCKEEDPLGFTTPIIVAVRKGFDSSLVVALIKRALAGNAEAVTTLDHTLAIIDGQHRFEGVLSEAAELDLDVVLLLIHGLEYVEETEEFNVINTTPKRLPKALAEWSRFGITEDTSASWEREIRKIAVQLATDAESPWFARINLTGTGREPGRPVTLEGMRRSSDNKLRAGGLRHLTYDRRYEMVCTQCPAQR